MDVEVFKSLGIAFGLGMLVGLQREWAAKKQAGIRTFPLITVFGCLSGLLAKDFGGWVVAAAIVAITAVIFWGNWANAKTTGVLGPGLTSEMAALVMFMVGVMLAAGYTLPAVAVGGAVAVLLQSKQRLHGMVEMIGENDIRAIMRLVLIGLVILPVLPNRAFDPYAALNPFKIWLMVVLIVGISLGAYIVARFYGKRGGTIAAGVLGGLISSTATTVSYARRTKTDGTDVRIAALVIVIASTIVFVRILFEIALVAREAFAAMAPPLLAIMLLMAASAGIMFMRARGELATPEKEEPPSDFKASVVFGLLYALVILALAVARRHLGNEGLYAVAALSGLTDMDAITLSTAQLVRAGQLEAAMGWRLILVGGMANLVFKVGVTAVLGGRGLFVRMLLIFGVALAGGGAILLFWPG